MRKKLRAICAGVLIDGNPANMTMSIGHVVRGNSVRGHRAPPTRFSNFDGAITVGVDALSPTCGCKNPAPKIPVPNKPAGTCCFGSVETAITGVIVEDNRVIVDTKNGSCAQNGVRVFAANTVERGNTCTEEQV